MLKTFSNYSVEYTYIVWLLLFSNVLKHFTSSICAAEDIEMHRKLFLRSWKPWRLIVFYKISMKKLIYINKNFEDKKYFAKIIETWVEIKNSGMDHFSNHAMCATVLTTLFQMFLFSYGCGTKS